MSFNKKTISDINLAGKRVLMRADYNVSIKNGVVIDDYRIRESVETIKHILHAGAKSLVIISHLGRPDGKVVEQYSLALVAKKLSDLLGKKVEFSKDCVGEKTKADIAQLPEGGVILLENLRFHAEEEKNDSAFAKELVDTTGAEVFVQDAFGAAHRAHASTEAITKFLPSVAGSLLEKEVATITQVISDPKRPFTALVGGAKIPDKIDVLKKFIEISDCVAIGGALANDFLRASRIKVGESLYDEDSVQMAREIMGQAAHAERNRGFNFLIPEDVVVSHTMDGKSPTRIVDLTSNAVADIESYPKKPAHRAFNIGIEEKILDIGPVTAGVFAGAIRMSKTVIWSGTMGVTEVKGLAGASEPFAHGTRIVVEAMIGTSNQHANRPFTVVGGGDTVGYVESQDLIADFNHVSTGGTASLELIAGHRLPAVEALLDK